jgi:uncharacterized Zn ribbon protein
MIKLKAFDKIEIDNINNLTGKIYSSFYTFWDYNLISISKTNNEHIFLQYVLGLYKLYVDCGGSRLKYIISQSLVRFNPFIGEMNNHYSLVCSLRSYYAHNNIDIYYENRAVLEKCEKWFRKTCGMNYPTNEDMWRECCDSLATSSNEFCERIHLIFNNVLKDKNNNITIYGWSQHYANDFPLKMTNDILKEIFSIRNISLHDIDKTISSNKGVWAQKYEEDILKTSLQPYYFLKNIIEKSI